MGNEYRAKVFKSGNSVALRLPKALGIAEGTEMVVREDAGRYAFEPAPAADRIDVSSFWGKAPGARPLTREERTFDPRPSNPELWSGTDE